VRESSTDDRAPSARATRDASAPVPNLRSASSDAPMAPKANGFNPAGADDDSSVPCRRCRRSVAAAASTPSYPSSLSFVSPLSPLSLSLSLSLSRARARARPHQTHPLFSSAGQGNATVGEEPCSQ